MLKTRIANLLVLQNRSFKTFSAILSKKTEDQLRIFETLPDFGNTNTNPLKHHRRIQSKDGRKNGKMLNVAILGVPNSGKSSLINKFLGKEVCPSSCKRNTTRHNSRAILNQGDTQIVFLDTPGVVDPREAKKFKLDSTLENDPEKSCKEADLLLVLQDVSNRYTREAIDPKILRLLCKYFYRVPSILVLNKLDSIPRKYSVYNLIRKLTCNRLDAVKITDLDHEEKMDVEAYLKRLKRRGIDPTNNKDFTMDKILDECRKGWIDDNQAEFIVAGLLGWPGFREVFSISAKDGQGVADLKKYLIDMAHPGPQRFSPDLLVDADPRESVVNIIKSKLLDFIDGEVPFALQPRLEFWEYDRISDSLRISVSIECHTPRQAKCLIGKNGKTIDVVARESEAALTEFCDHNVRLNIVPVLPKPKEAKTTTSTTLTAPVFI